MVGAGVGGGLLRRHVGGRAERAADLRDGGVRGIGARGGDGFRDAEVADDGAATGEEHVVRLDVAVHDAVLVRVGQRFGDVAQDADGLADG